jgi:hypothetical protein
MVSADRKKAWIKEKEDWPIDLVNDTVASDQIGAGDPGRGVAARHKGASSLNFQQGIVSVRYKEEGWN